MAKKKEGTIKLTDDGKVGYAPVKWRGHTLKVIGLAEAGLLCIAEGNAAIYHPLPVFYVPQSEAEN